MMGPSANGTGRLDFLAALLVADNAGDDSALLWATDPRLPRGARSDPRLGFQSRRLRTSTVPQNTTAAMPRPPFRTLLPQVADWHSCCEAVTRERGGLRAPPARDPFLLGVMVEVVEFLMRPLGGEVPAAPARSRPLSLRS
jgi:hypothetical protein